MSSRRLTLAPALAVVAGLLVLPSGPAQAADMDCGDFASQRAAQIFFLRQGGPSADPHGLDSEGDGIACESNPAPYYYGTTPPSSGGTAPAPAPKPRTITQFGRVIRVVDGDTLDVRLHSGRQKRVRMIGIDTPEVYGGTECGGPQASRSLKRQLPQRTRVKLVSDPTQDATDRYGRLLRYVTKVSTGKDVNRAQVWRGWAEVYVYGGTAFNRVTSYRKAERSARAHDRGIWRRCR